ncbi:MAG: glycosyltransferase [Elusimicrobia bacterium]|nr:glycosyltransferase [Elusimicrobiota bacterium]
MYSEKKDSLAISTIILHFGNEQLTRNCIQSVLNDSYPINKILVIENGLQKNTQTLKNEFTSVTFLSLKKNLGFAGGINFGIAQATRLWKPEFYFILNNDAEIKQGCLLELVNPMKEDSSIGLSAPKIFSNFEKKILWAAGGEFIVWRSLAKNRGLNKLDIGQYERKEKCNFLSACALMIKRETIENVGEFDEVFFTYSEDLDYCLRAQKLGWKLLYVPKAEVVHLGSKSSGGEFEPYQSFYRWRNRLLVIYKNSKLQNRILFLLFLFPLIIMRDMLRYLRLKKINSILFCWLGLIQSIFFLFLKKKIQPLSPNFNQNGDRLNFGLLAKNPLLIFFIKILDFFLSQVVHPKKIFSMPSPKKILIVKIDHLGDVLMSLQILPAIKNSFPNAEIHYIAGSWAVPILKENPFIHQVYTFNHFLLNRQGCLFQSIYKMILDTFFILKKMRDEKYDLSLDLRAYFPNFIPFLFLAGNKVRIGFPTGGFSSLLNIKIDWREGIHETEHFFDLIKEMIPNPKREPISVDYLISENELKPFLDKYDFGKTKNFILLHPFSGANLKNQQSKHWKISEWKKIISYLENANIQPIMTGSIDDLPFTRELTESSSCINLAGRTTIPLLAGLIKKAKGVVCIDTFIAHLSSCINQETIILFNQNRSPEQWMPFGDHTKIISIQKNAGDVILLMKEWVK